MIEIVLEGKRIFFETLFSIKFKDNTLISFPKLFNLPLPCQDSILEFVLLIFPEVYIKKKI